MTVSFQCSGCSKDYRVGDEFSGKRVRCKCGKTMQLPVPAAVPEIPDSSFGDFLEEALNEPISPVSLPAIPRTVSPRTTSRQAEAQQGLRPGKRQRKRSRSDLDGITIATAVLCILQGLWMSRILLSPFIVLGGRVFLSFSGILNLCSLAVAVGMVAVGVGLLAKQTWALPVGSAVAAIYFAFMVISTIVGLVYMAQAGFPLGLGYFVSIIKWMVIQSIAPGLVIHLNQRD